MITSGAWPGPAFLGGVPAYRAVHISSPGSFLALVVASDVRSRTAQVRSAWQSELSDLDGREPFSRHGFHGISPDW